MVEVEKKTTFLPGVTIDDISTRDIDDAFWIEKTGSRYLVRVMIADVAKYVKPGSDVDLLARDRVETRYFGTGNSPMLPAAVEHRVSLWPDEPKKVIVIEASIGEDRTIDDLRVYRAMMVSQAKLSYPDIQKILQNEKDKHHEMIQAAYALTMKLLEQRRNEGAMVFYDLEHGWVTTEEGSIHILKHREDTIGYIIIQELMITANVLLAEYAVKSDLPFLYRNHTARDAAPRREEMVELIENAKTKPIENIEALRHTTYLLFNKAEYGSTLKGHYGLNLGAYTHFTSPIRRYADLVNHQQLHAQLKGEPIPYTKEELDAIACRINEHHREAYESRNTAEKKFADDMARKMINARKIDGASDKMFERITKVQVREGVLDEAYADAFAKRAIMGRMPLLSAAFVLLKSPGTVEWAPLRQLVVDRLAIEPPWAVGVIAMAKDIAGWSMAEYISREEEGLFYARAKVRTADTTIVTEEIGDKIKKSAQQKAAVLLLARASGATPPEMKIPKRKTPEVEKPASNGEKTSIALLQEMGQADGRLPHYTFEVGGAPHTPTFTCTCAYAGVSMVATARTKQEAKHTAAQAVLVQLEKQKSGAD